MNDLEGVADGIRGSIHWDDGMDSKLVFERHVNGRERRVLNIDLDGVRYVPVKTSDFDTEVMNV